MLSLDDALRAMEQLEFRGALSILDSLSPEDLEVKAKTLFYRAWCRENLGDSDKNRTADMYQQAALLASDPRLSGDAWFRSGCVLLGADEPSRAEQAFARSLDRLSAAGIRSELYAHAAYWQTTCWEGEGKYIEASERYEAIGQLDDSLRADCYYRRIHCMTAVGALRDALVVCNEALDWIAHAGQPKVDALRALIASERESLHKALDEA